MLIVRFAMIAEPEAWIRETGTSLDMLQVRASQKNGVLQLLKHIGYHADSHLATHAMKRYMTTVLLSLATSLISALPANVDDVFYPHVGAAPRPNHDNAAALRWRGDCITGEHKTKEVNGSLLHPSTYRAKDCLWFLTDETYMRFYRDQTHWMNVKRDESSSDGLYHLDPQRAEEFWDEKIVRSKTRMCGKYFFYMDYKLRWEHVGYVAHFAFLNCAQSSSFMDSGGLLVSGDYAMEKVMGHLQKALDAGYADAEYQWSYSLSHPAPALVAVGYRPAEYEAVKLVKDKRMNCTLNEYVKEALPAGET
ncbi:MAG: hypothetical protein LQ340_006954, partial [Diploschistes diacapsis]